MDAGRRRRNRCRAGAVPADRPGPPPFAATFVRQRIGGTSATTCPRHERELVTLRLGSRCWPVALSRTPIRSHGYIHDLLAAGTSLLAAQNLPRIRAATDVGNAPMATAFALAGYVIFERQIDMTWR
jgi:hypothetical protein